MDESLHKLALIRDSITDEQKPYLVQRLQNYLENNQDYMVNYNKSEKANKPFTSQVAQFYVDYIINARHKRKQKMQ